MHGGAYIDLRQQTNKKAFRREHIFAQLSQANPTEVVL